MSMCWPNCQGSYGVDRYKKLRWQALAGLEYALFGKGPVASNIVEGGAFWWGDRTEKTPDIQFHFLPGAGIEEGIGSVPGGNGCTLNSYHLRPRSRGTVTLRSADPREHPVIDVNAFADPYDLERAVDGIAISREILSQPAFARYVRREHLPGKRHSEPRRHGGFRPAIRRVPPTIRSAPAAWAATRTRWSIRRSGCAASKACASATVR